VDGEVQERKQSNINVLKENFKIDNIDANKNTAD
jgi:hypothetical protein